MKENHREGEEGEYIPYMACSYCQFWGTDSSWDSRLLADSLYLWLQDELHLSLKECSGDVLLGWEAVRFHSPSPNYRELRYAIQTFRNPGLLPVGEPLPVWFSGRVSVNGTVCLMGQPRIWSPRHRNGPIRFLEPFCHLEENSISSYLFKECSWPYLIAINRSSQDVTSSVVSWECSL